MKRNHARILAVITAVIMILFATACGNKADTEVANVTETVEEKTTTEETTVEAPVAEPTEASTPEPTEEPTPEPTEEPVAEFTRDIAMEKVVNLFNARNELFKNGKVDTDLNFLVAAETLTGGIELTGVTTADGVNTDEDNYPKLSTITNYFYDYVNNNCGYYDLGEYLTSHTYDEIIDKYSFNLKNEEWDTEEIIMLETIGVIPYLLTNMDNMTFGELIVCDENCKINPVSGVEVCYEMPLLINEEKCGVTAVFDEAGNLLNLITVDEDGWSDDNYGDSTQEVLALEQ